MKHEHDVSNMVGCLQVVRIYSFMKEIKVYIRASYISFLFVKTENNNFIKEIKHVLRAFIAWWKPRHSLWEFSTASQVFTDLLSNSPKRSPRFSPGYKGTENIFNFLNITLNMTLICSVLVCTYDTFWVNMYSNNLTAYKSISIFHQDTLNPAAMNET